MVSYDKRARMQWRFEPSRKRESSGFPGTRLAQLVVKFSSNVGLNSLDYNAVVLLNVRIILHTYEPCCGGREASGYYQWAARA